MDGKQRPAEYFYPAVQQHMTLQAYMMRVHQAQWARKREKLWASAQQQLFIRLKEKIVNDRMRELTTLTRLRDELMRLAMPSEMQDPKDESKTIQVWQVEPKTLGEVIHGLKWVFDMVEQEREKLSTDVGGSVPQTDEERGVIDGPLSHDDAVEVAREVLKRTISSQRARIVGVDAKEDPKKSA